MGERLGVVGGEEWQLEDEGGANGDESSLEGRVSGNTTPSGGGGHRLHGVGEGAGVDGVRGEGDVDKEGRDMSFRNV